MPMSKPQKGRRAGLGQSLGVARAMDACFRGDRDTGLSFGNRGKLELPVDGDPDLLSRYSVIADDPKRCPGVRHEAAKAFIHWLFSERRPESDWTAPSRRPAPVHPQPQH